MSLLVAFCNPLLDVTVEDEGGDLITKYGLSPNNAILAEEGKHDGLFQEILTNPQRQLSAGGAAQNSMRAAQWLLPPNSCTFIGCVGKDEQADHLRRVAQEDGLRVEYAVDEEHSTGLCACLIQDHERSLVARLGAANHYPASHIEQPAIQELLKEVRIIYCSGYFLTVSAETVHHVMRRARIDQITAINLSAPFIPKLYKEVLGEAIYHADWVFGNESEALAWAVSHDLPDPTPLSVAMHLANLPSSRPGPRSVCITQGCEPTILITSFYPQGLFIPVPEIPAEEIVDTNGAGDAFAGAFLALLALERPIDEACRLGHWVAAHILRQSGVHFDQTKKPSIN